MNKVKLIKCNTDTSLCVRQSVCDSSFFALRRFWGILMLLLEHDKTVFFLLSHTWQNLDICRNSLHPVLFQIFAICLFVFISGTLTFQSGIFVRQRFNNKHKSHWIRLEQWKGKGKIQTFPTLKIQQHVKNCSKVFYLQKLTSSMTLTHLSHKAVPCLSCSQSVSLRLTRPYTAFFPPTKEKKDNSLKPFPPWTVRNMLS